MGLSVNQTRVTNGGARSSLWSQITADVIGLPLEHIAHHPGSALGAAFVAGIGVGLFQDWGEIDRFLKVEKTTSPIEKNVRIYQDYFEVYRTLYKANKLIFPLLTINPSSM
jgi:xylulokinase